jgi:hypothetical protein
MTIVLTQSKGAIFPVGVALALSIFVGTFYVYFSCHQAHVQRACLTVTISSALFLCVMTMLNYLTQVNGTLVIRLIKAAVIGVAQTALFLTLLWFLIINTIGV